MDLNREVAEKVMGWKDMGYWADDYGHAYSINIEDTQCSCEIWNPLEDLNQCFEIVKKMNGFFLLTRTLDGDGFLCILGVKNIHVPGTDPIKGTTPNEAILKAALEIVK